MIFGAPVERGVNHPAVDANIFVSPLLMGCDLSLDDAAKQGLQGCKSAQDFLDRWNLIGVRALGDRVSQAGNQLQLFMETYVGLMIAQAVRGRLEKDASRLSRILISENAFPRYFHILAQHHRVRFIIPGAQGGDGRI